MRVLQLLAVAFSALAAAESTTTIGYFWPEWSITIPTYTSAAGSVAGINALATTYEVRCLKGAPTTSCDIKHPWTLVQGPQTMSFTGVYTAWLDGGVNGVTATRSAKCSFTSYSESAFCSLSYKATGTVNGVSYSTSTSATKSFATDHVAYFGLAVTGGLKSFTAPQATKTPGAAAPAPARAFVTAAPVAAAVVAVAVL